MVVPFQMNATVDKEKSQKIFRFSLEFDGFFFGFRWANVDLALILGKRETEDVGWDIFLAILIVQFLNAIG